MFLVKVYYENIGDLTNFIPSSPTPSINSGQALLPKVEGRVCYFPLLLGEGLRVRELNGSLVWIS
jgi:hypothetical protein